MTNAYTWQIPADITFCLTLHNSGNLNQGENCRGGLNPSVIVIWRAEPLSCSDLLVVLLFNSLGGWW